jgi:hypothetical protein
MWEFITNLEVVTFGIIINICHRGNTVTAFIAQLT